MKILNPNEYKLPVFTWCEDVEEDNLAMEQILNLANHPDAFHHIAVMPDCLEYDTEVLTEVGFKKIREISRDEVIANYDITSGKIFFKKVRSIVNRELRDDERMFEFKSTLFEKSIICTENHRMAFKEDLGKKASDIQEISSLDDYLWMGEGIVGDTQLDISYELLCLIPWVVGDGSIKLNNKRKEGKFSSRTIRFGFTKERKINRVLLLLDSLGFRYNCRKDKNQVSIELNTRSSDEIISYVGEKKEYPKEFLTTLSHEQALVFLNEALKVDGDYENYIKHGGKKYFSKKETDINFLASLMAIHCGISNHTIRTLEGFNGPHELNNLSLVDSISESKSGIQKSKIVKKEIVYDKRVVCLSCDTSFFIARQNGLSFVSGNCHAGYGMPIGGVAAFEGVVIPNAVGVDIGCGMCSVGTNASTNHLTDELIKEIIDKVREKIPVGFEVHAFDSNWGWGKLENEAHSFCDSLTSGWWTHAVWDRAMLSIGTLGGGNHFIELQLDTKDRLNLMIHSGSRNLGHTIATYYNNVAKEEMRKWHSHFTDDLAFLPVDSKYGADYILDMNFALKYAEENRRILMEVFKDTVSNLLPGIEFTNEINIHHNYAALEHHFGKNVWVHRKGATSAKDGELGIIPGSMGTASYIIRGKGNKDSFMSCSHGAGRVMSRTQASNTLTEEECNYAMRNIYFNGWGKNRKGQKDFGEAPQAYKDIHEVIDSQVDLVDIVEKLHPIGVLKG